MNATSATEETTATITLRNYIDLHSPFIIPEYQRGYIWGKNKKDGKDAVTFMMDSLLNGFKSNSTVFIQGVTVAKTSEGTILVDGQQRTTFFYLLLKKLGWKNRFEIEYRIREESNSFLSDYNSSTEIVESAEEKYQDIFFFKKTLRIIDQKLTDVKFNEKDYETFKEYLLERVTFLYIEIPSDKAGTVFTMMNGNKAIMKPEELIKAELLRIASLNEEGKPSSSLYAREWECNMLRSRYAREWDRWLQWWNQPGVIALFRVDNTMGYLLTTYYHGGLEGKNKVSLMTFESFVNLFLKCSQPKEARETFDGLRRLQKRFEGAYNDPKTYNQIGAILRVATDADKFLNWYFLGQKPSIEELDRYYRLAFLKVKHKEIVESDTDAINNRYKECYEALQSDRLYMDNPEEAFYLLLRMNIDEDNNQEDGKGRKFDFSIWDRNDSKGRSLEHIYPKSKVYHKKNSANNETFYLDGNDHEISESVINGVDKSSYINRDDCVFTDSEGREIKASEHSIGNLVLLYKDDNSSFNNSSFEEKKTLYFRRPTEGELARAIFKSRHLLHTIYLFSNSQWTGEEIAKNKQATLKNFEEYYQSFIEK